MIIIHWQSILCFICNCLFSIFTCAGSLRNSKSMTLQGQEALQLKRFNIAFYFIIFALLFNCFCKTSKNCFFYCHAFISYKLWLSVILHMWESFDWQNWNNENLLPCFLQLTKAWSNKRQPVKFCFHASNAMICINGKTNALVNTIGCLSWLPSQTISHFPVHWFHFEFWALHLPSLLLLEVVRILLHTSLWCIFYYALPAQGSSLGSLQKCLHLLWSIGKKECIIWSWQPLKQDFASIYDFFILVSTEAFFLEKSIHLTVHLTFNCKLLKRYA